MQPTMPKPTPPSPGQNHPSGPGHPEINYTAPAYGHDANNQGHHPDYNFIMEPGKTPGKSLLPQLNLGGSFMGRLVIVLGGLVILLVLFAIIKGLLGGGGSNVGAFNTVAQEQQALYHLATAAKQQTGTSQVTQASSNTIAVTMASAQQQLFTYMRANHLKINAKGLNQKVSASQDTQLTSAVDAGTYDSVYVSTMQTTLSSYEQALKQAYNQTSGPVGKALLTDQFNGAELLVKQLGVSPASQSTH